MYIQFINVQETMFFNKRAIVNGPTVTQPYILINLQEYKAQVLPRLLVLESTSVRAGLFVFVYLYNAFLSIT